MPEPEARETAVEKDPTKNRFWRTRNILALIIMGVTPVAGKTTWDWTAKVISERDVLSHRVKILEDGVGGLEDRLNEKAVWEAIAEIKNQQLKIEVQLAVIQKLFDREFGRSEYRAELKPTLKLDPDRIDRHELTIPKVDLSPSIPRTEQGSPPAIELNRRDIDKLLEEIKKKYGADYFKAEEYKRLLEQKYPNEPVQKK